MGARGDHARGRRHGCVVSLVGIDYAAVSRKKYLTNLLKIIYKYGEGPNTG